VSSATVRAFAPGRVNLIGEHTDYNGGLCLPFAIARGVSVTAEPLAAPRIEVRAAELDEEDSFRLGERTALGGWRAFVRGVAGELTDAGFELRGARLVIASDLPRGAGLASSAALEAALCLALLGLAGAAEPDRLELARLCSRVENDWVGAETGLLDQLAVLLGVEGHALRLDLSSLDVRQVALEPGDWTLATLDSGASHQHAASGYNERREECRRACAQLGIASLRQATMADPDRLAEPLGRRVRHVVSENERVEAAVAALGRGDHEAIARLLDASHASLRDDYEVSLPEVERARERCLAAGALGARIVGGGFGGSVLALFPPGARPPAGSLKVAPGAAAGLV
jgi:galactokinase